MANIIFNINIDLYIYSITTNTWTRSAYQSMVESKRKHLYDDVNGFKFLVIIKIIYIGEYINSIDIKWLFIKRYKSEMDKRYICE